MPRRLAGTKSVVRQEAGTAIHRWRGLLLSGTALSLGAAFSLAGSPAALAACTAAGANPVVITCNDTTTDNTDNPLNNVNARNQIQNDDIAADVQAGATVDGYGLRIETTLIGGTIDMDHQGDLVELSEGPPPADTGDALLGPGALELNGNGGLIQYTGNGAVRNLTADGAGVLITNNGAGGVEFGTAATPIVPDYTGPTALSIHSSAGNQNIYLDGGTLVSTDPAGAGLFSTAKSGDITIELTGNTSIITTAAPANTAAGVRANSAVGSVTISSDADIGSAGFEFHTGISSTAGNGGAIDITQTGGTILATNFGIRAVTSGANAGIEIATDAGSQIDMTGGTGIRAKQQGTAGGIVVTLDGDINSAKIGVKATITNAANADDIVVTASSIVQAVTGNSIEATTAGTGDVTVNLLDGAALEGGLLARSVTGNAAIVAGDDVTVIGNSPGAASITAGGNATQLWGDNATVSGSSGLVVDQTSPPGAGVATVVVGDNGEITGDGTDATDGYNGNGIFAGNQGTGLTSVTTGTNTSVTGEANGIVAFQTNAQNANDITITTDGPVTGDGAVAFVLSPYSDAFVAAGLPTTGLGIGVSNQGAGDIIIDAGDTVTGANVGIQTLANGGGDTSIATGGAVAGGIDGINAEAAGAGNINIDVSAGATVTGTTGSGVVTETAAGSAAIDNAGRIEGAFAAISSATGTVIEIVNQAGGAIRNLSADLGDLAISVTGAGVADIDNDGTIRGRIATDAGNDSLSNSGRWRTTGISDFGAGKDSIVNTGRITVAEEAAEAEITRFANLESFTNASTGVIDLVDGSLGDAAAGNAPGVSDELTIEGAYTGIAGSVIELDLALVAGYDPQTSSDLLILDPANPATGTTDFLFNIVSTGATATTADTGRVGFAGGQLLLAPVTVVENRGTLATGSGDDVIPLARSGLVSYDLVSTAAAGGDYQVVSQLEAGLAGGLLLPIPATLATVAFTTQRTPNPITATCIDPANKPNAQGGWVRGFAGEFDTENKGTAAVNGTTSGLESENTTRFRTLQGGFDHVICNLDEAGSTLHLGVTVGQTWGESRQTDPDRLAGLFGTEVDFDTFFIGPYAAYTRGDFAAQAALRFDYHSLELSNATAGIDADGIDVDANGLSGSTSMSYDFELDDLTLTPDIGVNVSTTEIDKFGIAGATVVLDDLWSVMGHAGVTARTTLTVTDNVFVVPFASATLYHEFVDGADSTLILGPSTVEVESNRVGTFGQLGVGANAVRLGDVVAGRPTLFGGARVDLQVGERIEGATATVFGRVQF